MNDNQQTVETASGMGDMAAPFLQPLLITKRPVSSSAKDEQELIKLAKAQMKAAKRTTTKHAKMEKAENIMEHDMAKLADKIARGMKNVGREFPTVEIQYNNLTVETDALVGEGSNPTVGNSFQDVFRRLTCRGGLATRPLKILDSVTGMLKPGRITLLLGPPGGGKSVFLQALSGRLRQHSGLRITGDINYNGVPVNDFYVRRTCGLVNQTDEHVPNFTVLETVQFAGDCQTDKKEQAAMLVSVDKLGDASEKAKKRSVRGGGAALPTIPDSHLDGQDAREDSGSSSGVQQGSNSNNAADIVEVDNETGDLSVAEEGIILSDEDKKLMEELKESLLHNLKPYITLQMLGLEGVADTFVGNAAIRGISGGQRKRVTSAEVLAGPQWAILMDEISTGLDSATTFAVVQSLKDVCHALQRTVLISLLQPAPEVLELFDDIILLTDGKVMYHGPVSDVLEFYETVGFACPPRKDPASFLQEITTPVGQLAFATPELLTSHGIDEESRSPDVLLANPPKELIMPIDDMITEFWDGYPISQALATQSAQPMARTAESDKALARKKYANNWRRTTYLVFKRQVLLMKRNKAYYAARIVQTLVMSLIISSLYATIEPSIEDGRTVISMAMLSVTYLSMINTPQVGLVFAIKNVFFKHRENNFYPPWSYVLSCALNQIPPSTVESIIYSVITYWIVGFYADAGYFFLYLWILWSASNCLAGIFQLIAYASPSMVVANAFGALVILLFIITNGFAITYTSIPDYLVWIYWINPLAWSIRALAVNELTSPAWGDTGVIIMNSFGLKTSRMWVWLAPIYLWSLTLFLGIVSSVVLRLAPAPAPRATISIEEQKEQVDKGMMEGLRRRSSGGRHHHQNAATQSTAKKVIRHVTTKVMELKDMPASISKKLSPSPIVPSSASDPITIGTEDSGGSSSTTTTREVVTVERVVSSKKQQQNGLETPDASSSTAVDFTPITLVCRNIQYYVADPSGGTAPGVVHKASEDKEVAGMLQLLKGFDFYAEPGQLTALMGGSGAGKTTLMDVVAGRKTTGIIRGEILVNGRPKQQASWARVVGYVEQMDIHSARATVREALLFSARLRNDEKTVPWEKVLAIVEETLETVELKKLQDKIVGDGSGIGLSLEQRKRLSIAVELVANPSVMFMDEPTSGLDARAAAIVMRAVRRIADKGRSILVTIHQPSIEIFEVFDQLVLLQRGGRLTYFGPLGLESCELIKYLESKPGVQPIKPRANPATWMLEVTGGSTATTVKPADLDFPDVYAESELCAENTARMNELVEEGVKSTKELSVGGKFATSYRTQNRMLVWKFVNIYWRTPHYNFTRIVIAFFVALAYGITYLNQGRLPSSGVDIARIQNVMGVIFSMSFFLGMFNAMTVMPVVSAERNVYYRERAARYYSPFPYNAAQGVAEIPYLLAQAVIMVCISYFLIGFQAIAWKFFYFLLMFFLAVSVFTFMGQFIVFATSSILISQLLMAFMSQLFTYFNGFLVPYPQIPAGWKWMNRISPSTWIIYGLAESQLGDRTDIPFQYVSSTSTAGTAASSAESASQDALASAAGAPTNVAEVMTVLFGYEEYMVWWCILIVAAYMVFFRLVGAFMLTFINYQKR